MSTVSTSGGGAGVGLGVVGAGVVGAGVVGAGAAQAIAIIIRARQTLPSKISILFLVISISFQEFSHLWISINYLISHPLTGKTFVNSQSH